MSLHRNGGWWPDYCSGHGRDPAMTDNWTPPQRTFQRRRKKPEVMEYSKREQSRIEKLLVENERLRNMMDDGGREILRLNRDIERLQADAQYNQGLYFEAQAEIERLTQAVCGPPHPGAKAVTNQHKHLQQMAREAANEDEDALLWALAEIKRQRVEIENWVAMSQRAAVTYDAEIEQLRLLVKEAANEIDELGFPGKADAFRRTLGPKP